MAESTPIRLICGLGNPGEKYAVTRHNAGFWLVDEIARRQGAAWSANARFAAETARVVIGGSELMLLKPQNYMNRSGESVAACIRYFRIEPAQTLVAHDELDLDPGDLRLKFGGGHGGHNGLRDIQRLIGADYWRLRIGIGHPGHKSEVVGYVLGRADADGERLIREAIGRAVEEMPHIAEGEMQRAMNRLHRRQPDPPVA